MVEQGGAEARAVESTESRRRCGSAIPGGAYWNGRAERGESSAAVFNALRSDRAAAGTPARGRRGKRNLFGGNEL
jgi:hypothetical protein